MRLLITGKTRSGKSTALHRLLSHALRLPWAGVVILDGKGSELHPYASVDGVTYYGPAQIERWSAELNAICARLPGRYASLAARGLRAAAKGDPRYLIVIDEVQRGTRDPEHGKSIKNALQLIAEQSAALGDVLILTAQRPEHSVPPNVRFNCNGTLTMLGMGYFHLTFDGQACSGRVEYITPEQALGAARGGGRASDLNNLPELLGCQKAETGRINATLYIGEPGGGKTYALYHHPSRARRRIYVDAAQPHRQLLLDVIQHAGAHAPNRATIPELLDMAALALSAEPTLILIDNVHQASDKMLPSIIRLISTAHSAALSAATGAQQQRLNSLLPYTETRRIEPLTRAEARALAVRHLPALDRRDEIASRIAAQAAGNPSAVVALAKRIETGSNSELRRFAPIRRASNIAWLLLVPVMALLILGRWQLDLNNHYWLALALLGASIIIRPFFYRSFRNAT